MKVTDLDIVQQHITRATRYLIEESEKEYQGWLFGNLNHWQCESPLEVMFWCWWLAVDRVRGTSLTPLSVRAQVPVEISGELFRIDFVIEARRKRILSHPIWTKIAVEVDGHAFHEKTLEQVAYRNHRDRALQQAGWRVFNFSFAELNASPERFVEDLYEFACNQCCRVLASFDDPLE